jgi:NADH:ubiquinone oxidoreductase subunit K
MAAGSQDRKLPPTLTYPFIVVSLLLACTALINISHRFQGALITYLGLILAICEIGLAIAVFIWLKRNRSRPEN